MPVQWTEDLAVGVAELDEQHRELFAAVAALRDSMRAGSVRGAGATVHYLERYVREHFAAEERRMAAAGCSGLEAHRLVHRAFAAELDRRMVEFDRRGATASFVLDLSEWLGAWLREHVQGVDREMARELTARTQRRAAAPR